MAHVTAVWDQDSFRWHNNVANEGASWIAATNTNFSPSPGTIYRLRFLIQETAGSTVGETPDFDIEYRVNTGAGFGAWTAVPTAGDTYFNTPAVPLNGASASLDNTTTTQQIGAGTFRGGNFQSIGEATGALTATGGNDEYEVEWAALFKPAAGGNIFEFRVIQGGAAITSYTNTPSVTVLDTENNLLANDVESVSNTATVSIGQTHVLNASDIQSTSEVANPDLSEENTLLADDVQSTSEVSSPTLAAIDTLLANDIESTSEVSAPALTILRALLAEDIESASEINNGRPYGIAVYGTDVYGGLPRAGVGTATALIADDIESTSEVTNPNIAQEHTVLAEDIESVSEVGTPLLGQEHGILSNDVESASEVDSPIVGQEHVLSSTSIQSISEVTNPSLVEVTGGDNLLAEDIQSASEVTASTIGQEHVILADDIESSSSVSNPVISQEGILLAEDIESASEVSVPTLGQEHALLQTSVESTSEVTNPTATEVAILTAEDIQSASEVTTPNIQQVSVLLANDIESSSSTQTVSMGVIYGFLANGVSSSTTVSTPNIVIRAPVGIDFDYLVSVNPENRMILVGPDSRDPVAYIAKENVTSRVAPDTRNLTVSINFVNRKVYVQ